MSSAILYLAIVAIWAIVLVPRWLRPPQASGTLESNLAEPVIASPFEDVAGAEEDAGSGESLPAPGAQAASGGRARPTAAERRERILQARRRMLVTLTVITAGSVVIALAHLAAAWVVIPPAVMLGGFVLLLHEAARIDTERAWAAARGTGADAVDGPERQQAARPTAPRLEWPTRSPRCPALRPGCPARRSSTSRAGSATSSTISTPTPRCGPSAIDGSAQPAQPPRGTRRRRERVARFATLTAVPLGL